LDRGPPGRAVDGRIRSSSWAITRPSSTEPFADFAEASTDQNERGHRALAAAVAAERVEAQSVM